MAGHRFVLAEDDVIRLLADDQVIAGVAARKSLGARLQLVEAARAEELQVREFRRPGEEVHVALDEAGDDAAAPGIGDAGRSPLFASLQHVCPRR